MHSKKIYFQSQGFFSMNCAVHCLNNFLGHQEFTKPQLTDICYRLSDEFINPHKHLFGGDFDMNVLMVALQTKGYQIEFMDMRKEINLKEEVSGYIINEIIARAGLFEKIGNMFSDRHWSCVKKVGDVYWFFNSKERAPMVIGDKKSLERFLVERRGKGDQICTIVKV